MVLVIKYIYEYTDYIYVRSKGVTRQPGIIIIIIYTNLINGHEDMSYEIAMSSYILTTTFP